MTPLEQMRELHDAKVSDGADLSRLEFVVDESDVAPLVSDVRKTSMYYGDKSKWEVANMLRRGEMLFFNVPLRVAAQPCP